MFRKIYIDLRELIKILSFEQIFKIFKELFFRSVENFQMVSYNKNLVMYNDNW